MTPPEVDGIAAALGRALAECRAALRAEHAAALAELRREAAEVARAAGERAERAEARAEQLRQDIEVARALAAEPALREGLIDAEGVLRIVQRNGDTLSVRLAALPALVTAAAAQAVAQAAEAMRAELRSEVARGLQRLGAAPRWSRLSIYGPGAVVACYSGRTYVLRDGVAASMSQEPGEHPEVWERIGTHGLRVLKSKPQAPEPGDIYSEGESRFIHDGENTTLLVPRALKQSDLDRSIKPTHALAQMAAEQMRVLRGEVDGLQDEIRTVGQAANDAAGVAARTAAWIASEGDAAVVRSATTEAWCMNRAALIDSPALARIADEGTG